MAKRNNGSVSYAKHRKKLLSEIIGNLKGTIPGRDYLILRVLDETACSVSELCQLRHDDLHGTVLRVASRKTRISQELSIGLRRLPATQFIFNTRQGSGINPRRIEQLTHKYLGTVPTKVRHQRILQVAQRDVQEAKRLAGIKNLRNPKTLAVRDLHLGNEMSNLAANLILQTGCKLRDLVHIKVQDIKAGSIMTAYGRIEISSGLAAMIFSYLKGRSDGYLFQSRQSDRISGKRIFQILRAEGKARGMDISPRTLRNTWISRTQAPGIKRLDFASYGMLHE